MPAVAGDGGGAGLGRNRSFDALRHTVETVGGEAKGQVAVDHAVGHARDDTAGAYRERISDDRLEAVSDHVRKWAFGAEEEGPAAATLRQPPPRPTGGPSRMIGAATPEGHDVTRPLAAFCLAALAPAAVPAAPVPTHLMPPGPPLAFPTAVGTTWVYALDAGGEQTLVVTAAEEEKDGSRRITLEAVEGGKRVPHQVRRVSADGVFVLVEFGREFERPVCLVRFPHRAGRAWETYHRGKGEDGGPTGRREAGPLGRVKVPAGEFAAAPVAWELGGRSGTNWYAHGVGLVKGGDGMQLKAFTPGKR